MQDRKSLFIITGILLIGFGVGLVLVLRPNLNPFGSRAGAEPTPLPTLAVGSPQETTTPLNKSSADLNADGRIDNTDAALWQTYFQENDSRGDLDRDGKVSSTDFKVLRQQISSQ